MENRHFTLVVAGNNPEILVEKYNANNEVEPYIVYEFKNAEKYRQQRIKVCEEILKADNGLKDYYQKELEKVKSMTDIEYYEKLTESFDLDKKTGNAISTLNPDGKYTVCRLGKNLALPLILKNGVETFSARKKDIDWSKIHLSNREPYEIAWDTVMEGKIPQNSEEENIYNNMKERKYYFSLFGNRENYIESNTAFWGYAFLDKNGWVELEDNIPQFEWVTNFYKRFIEPLPDSTLISIYECVR